MIVLLMVQIQMVIISLMTITQNPEGHKKATYEYIQLLNIAYNRWKSGEVVIPKTAIDFSPKSAILVELKLEKPHLQFYYNEK